MKFNKNAINIATVLTLALSSHSSFADVDKVIVAVQHGLTYLPVHVIQEQKLFEKHAKKAGLTSSLEVVNMGKPSALNDALLSKSVHYASLGTPSLVILNDRTKGKFKSAGSLAYVPMYLNTNNPNIKSIKDLTEKDKVAVPSVKVSIQAVALQMAAAKAFGTAKFDSLDKYTVSMTHPDGYAALMSGKSEITGHLTTPPYIYTEVANGNGKIKTIFNSYELFGGKHTLVSLVGSEDFVKDNPKAHLALTNALVEAQEWINKNKTDAAKFYIEKTGSKEPMQEVLDQIMNPDVEFNATPRGYMQFAQFMYDVKTIKTKPTSWKNFTFKELHSKQGN